MKHKMQVCSFCGSNFYPRLNHGKIQIYCSRSCSDKAREKTACTKCGSKETIKYHGLTLCIKCKKEYLKNRDRKDYKCIVCGEKYRIRPRESIEKTTQKYRCQKCSRYNLKITQCSVFFIECNICGCLFTSRNIENISCKKCSSSIIRKKKLNTHCVDCGIKVYRDNLGHSSTSFVCDQCMWLRRRKYKLKEKIGKTVDDTTLEKIFLIDVVSKFGYLKLTKRGTTWNEKKMIARVEELLKKLRSNHLKI